MGPSISLSGRGLSRNGPKDQQVMCSVNAFLCMSYAHEIVWAGADLDEDPQPTMETAEPQQTVRPRADSRKQSNRSRLDHPWAGSRTQSSMLSRQRRRCRSTQQLAAEACASRFAEIAIAVQRALFYSVRCSHKLPLCMPPLLRSYSMAAGSAFVPIQPTPFVFPTSPINPASDYCLLVPCCPWG